jgi:hypothetical protein
MSTIKITPDHIGKIIADRLKVEITKAIRTEVKKLFEVEIERVVTEYANQVIAHAESYSFYGDNKIILKIDVVQLPLPIKFESESV